MNDRISMHRSEAKRVLATLTRRVNAIEKRGYKPGGPLEYELEATVNAMRSMLKALAPDIENEIRAEVSQQIDR